MLDQVGFILGPFCFWIDILMQQLLYIKIIIADSDVHSVFWI